MAANQFTFPPPKFCHINVTNTPPLPTCNAVLTPSAFRFAFPAKKRQGALYITYPRHQLTQISNQQTEIPNPHHLLHNPTQKPQLPESTRWQFHTTATFSATFCNLLRNYRKNLHVSIGWYTFVVKFNTWNVWITKPQAHKVKKAALNSSSSS